MENNIEFYITHMVNKNSELIAKTAVGTHLVRFGISSEFILDYVPNNVIAIDDVIIFAFVLDSKLSTKLTARLIIWKRGNITNYLANIVESKGKIQLKINEKIYKKQTDFFSDKKLFGTSRKFQTDITFVPFNNKNL